MIDVTLPSDEIAAHKLALAAENLGHLLHIKTEQAAMENLSASLERTIIDAHANNPEDLCDMMATQSRLLDAAFHHFLEQTRKGTKGIDFTMALKAQNQTVRAINTWKKLKTETYIKRKIVTYSLPKEIRDERTGQNDPFRSPDDRL